MTKPGIIKNVLTVKRKEYITPNLIRIVLTGEAVVQYRNCTPGNNNKIMVPPPGHNIVHLAVYDPQKNEWIAPSPELTPKIRTYTHRAIDLEKNEMYIDFVNHGDGGPASAWANSAQAGDELGVAMKDQTKVLVPQAEWYLLVGDATAIPVISCILESLSSTAKVVCMLEVHGKEDELFIDSQAEVSYVWLHNEHPENGSLLASEAQKIHIPDTAAFAYVAAEYQTVKDLRTFFREEKKWGKDQFYAFSYWKAGVAEDQSASDRRQERDGES